MASSEDTAERLKAALADRYRIEREIGSGGMATVYLAQDLKHGRPVALKVLRPEVGVAMGQERFLREIEIAAQLNHPNILPLHDSGEAEGLLFFVMPYVEGDSLRERLAQEGPLSIPETLRIAGEVASALEFAHGQGLVHRDVKPGNVLLQAGHAQVCDFGIAKAATDAREHLTRTGLAVGTLGYMSPEQLIGEGEVDGRTDVFALGCIVYEMLTGETPFKATTLESVLARQLTGRVPDVTRIRPEVPDTIQAVLARALAPSPEDRFPTPETFAAALEHANTEEARAQNVRRRRRQRLMGVAATFVVVGLLATGSWRLREVFRGPEIRRVAVLPLTTRDNDPEQEYFFAGIHQDLVFELARAGIRVINASSMTRYRDSDRPIQEIADELHVDGVFQGFATRLGDSVGVELALVDPETQELLWVESFGSDIPGIVGLYRQATLTIAERLGVPLSAEARARLLEAPQEVDPRVFEALLQARFQWQKLTAEGFDTALDYFRLALERDSTSVEAWQGIALVWQARAQEGIASPEEASLHADSAMARVVALDPDFTEDPATLALHKTWWEWNWEEGEEAFLMALDEDPTDSLTRGYYAILLLYLGRTEEAEEQMERAAEMDPFNTLVQGLYAQGLNALHRYEEAEAHLLRVGEREPEAPIVLTTLRTTYHLMGRHDQAMEMWRASYRTAEDQEALEALERGWAEGGYSAALQAVAEVMVARSDTTYIRPIVIGTLYTRAGMKEEALTYLEAAYEERSPGIPYLSVDPIFDFLRDDPRFQTIIDEIGLPR
ncbi:protein kinase [Gemmatimonadota bacterium]